MATQACASFAQVSCAFVRCVVSVSLTIIASMGMAGVSCLSWLLPP